MSFRLERAYRLYRKRIVRCRTENQLNRVHIALGNYMTPAEVRYFEAALAGDPPDSPSCRWIGGLRDLMPTQKIRPIEFQRKGVLKGVTHYTAEVGSREQKTLILGLAGHFHRLMMPMPCLLNCLNPALFDLIVLRDFSRVLFTSGIPGLGGDFFEALSNLRRQFDLGSYRNTITLGTSSGGLPALLAAILLKLDRGISVAGMDFPEFAATLQVCGLSEEPYATLLASRPEPFPDLVLVYGKGNAVDAAAASALHLCVPSRLWEVKNCDWHTVLAWKLRQQRLPAFLAKVLGQSLEVNS